MTSTYWPHCHVNFSIAGKRSHMPITSGASGFIHSIRQGSSRISTSVTCRISWISMTRSSSACAWQISAWPAVSSSVLMPSGRPRGYAKPPRMIRTRQVPQEPLLQLCGRLKCWRSAAVSTGTSGRASNSRLEGRTLTFIRPLWAKRRPRHLSMRGPQSQRTRSEWTVPGSGCVDAERAAWRHVNVHRPKFEVF